MPDQRHNSSAELLAMLDNRDKESETRGRLIQSIENLNASFATMSAQFQRQSEKQEEADRRVWNALDQHAKDLQRVEIELDHHKTATESSLEQIREQTADMHTAIMSKLEYNSALERFSKPEKEDTTRIMPWKRPIVAVLADWLAIAVNRIGETFILVIALVVVLWVFGFGTVVKNILVSR